MDPFIYTPRHLFGLSGFDVRVTRIPLGCPSTRGVFCVLHLYTESLRIVPARTSVWRYPESFGLGKTCTNFLTAPSLSFFLAIDIKTYKCLCSSSVFCAPCCAVVNMPDHCVEFMESASGQRLSGAGGDEGWPWRHFVLKEI